MKDQLGKSFGLVIAFLIPGMIGLYAASFYVRMIQEWFGTAASQSTNVGGFLFVVVASVGMGVFISGVRWFALERILWHRPISLPDRTEKTEPIYQNLVHQHYYFYLFYANSLVALIVLYVAWLAATSRSGGSIAIMSALGVGAGVILFFSAKDALGRFDLKSSQLHVVPARESA